MEGEVCQFDKFGFCKHKQNCKRRHFVEECNDLSKCKVIKSCLKRHPKACKKFVTGHCRFENDCAYKHEKLIPNKEQVEMTEKLKQLEVVLHAMTRKVLSMEKEIKELRINNEKNQDVKGLEDQEIGIDVKDVSENYFNPKSFSSPKVKDNTSQSNVKKDKIKKNEKEKVFFKCAKCEYKSKKEEYLKKHVLTKHEEHACKECKEIFQSFMELLKHISLHHFKETGEGGGQSEEEETSVKKEKNVHDKLEK